MTNVEANLGQIYQGAKNGNNVRCMKFQSQCSFRKKVCGLKTWNNQSLIQYVKAIDRSHE